ncbi:MAG TPA: amidohydrolase family protein [Acidimicrobiia bacterium]|nr:amidohydrolase family protein [Acidimicrobiia bacterium]
MEPAEIWTSRLPSRLREHGPHVRRERGVLGWDDLTARWSLGGQDAEWADVWYYDDLVWVLQRGFVQAGYVHEDPQRPITYDDMLPGAYQREERLRAMERNHTDVSICFPNMIRFCGQIFLDRKDKDLALLCVKAYNDWMIDEWCGAERPARLVPLTIVPLWDVHLAAAEVRRCAAKGAHAVTFPEAPPGLGLPSIFSSYWDPLFAACEETDTVLNLHVGSSSKSVTTAADAPRDMAVCFLFVNSQLAFSDWLYSGLLEDFGRLKIVLSEGQVGWMPFVVQRIDNTWKKSPERKEKRARRAKQLPSSAIPGRVFGCIFDDLEGLVNRHAIGTEQIMVETDFPHSDSTYPHSRDVLSKLVSEAGLTESETRQITRENAIRVYGLDRYFGISS